MDIKKIKKAVIPAAGLGTRFLPITKAVPKPMLPILDKPTIQYIAEELDSVGIKDIIIVVSPESDVISKHFGKAETLEKRLIEEGKTKLYEIERETRKYNVRFVVQDKPDGLGGALLRVAPYLEGEPFALLLGDELMCAEKGETPCIKTLVDVYEKTGKSVLATMPVFGDELSKYGNIGIKEEKEGVMAVSEVIEKPSVNDALSNNAVIGRYVFTYEMIDILKNVKTQGNELYLTEAFNVLAGKDRLLAAEFEGMRYDVGDKFGFIKANVEYALKSEETKSETEEYILALAEKIKNS